MNKQIEPTQINERIIADFLAIEIKQSLRKKNPTADEILEELR